MNIDPRIRFFTGSKIIDVLIYLRIAGVFKSIGITWLIKTLIRFWRKANGLVAFAFGNKRRVAITLHKRKTIKKYLKIIKTIITNCIIIFHSLEISENSVNFAKIRTIKNWFWIIPTFFKSFVTKWGIFLNISSPIASIEIIIIVLMIGTRSNATIRIIKSLK